MIETLIVAGLIASPIETNHVILEIKPIVKEQKIEKPLTVEEKIKSNFYKCNTDVEWIRADNATCLPKQVQTVEYTSQPQNTVKTPQNTSGNLYDWGNCTYYAKNRRPDLSNSLGNANTWTARAATQGYATGLTPRAGAIGQKGMHVVYVESVNPDGTFNLSEMNYQSLGVVTYRTVSSVGWSFIY